MMNQESNLEWSDFLKVEMRVGTILTAVPFAEARKPAYKLVVDFGPFGQKKSSAQITDFYQVEELVGMQVVAVVNFPKKQIANFMSECLILGSVDDQGRVILLTPSLSSENGLKIA